MGSYHFSNSSAGRMSINNLTIKSAGIFQFIVETENGLVSESNPVFCQENAEPYKLFWGELHGHTQFSDGYGTAEEYLKFAGEKALLDFAAITDHDVELDAPDYTVKQMWQETQSAVAKSENPSSFIAIPAGSGHQIESPPRRNILMEIIMSIILDQAGQFFPPGKKQAIRCLNSTGK